VTKTPKDSLQMNSNVYVDWIIPMS